MAMSMRVSNQFSLAVLLVMFAVIYYTLRKAKSGKVPTMRPLPALDHIHELIGRCAELGRPVFMAPGMGEIEQQWAAETLAALSVIHYGARIAARMNVPIISIVVKTTVQPLCEDTIRSAYAAEGKAKNYDPSSVRYIPYGMAYDVAILGVAERERPAGALLIGMYPHPILFSIESLHSVGAMMAGGTSRTVMTPFLIGGCDYFLIGEEVLAAGAYVSDDVVPKGSFEGQDIMKIFSVVLIAIGVVVISLGSRLLIDLLRM